jgi:hypothetical protein
VVTVSGGETVSLAFPIRSRTHAKYSNSIVKVQSICFRPTRR